MAACDTEAHEKEEENMTGQEFKEGQSLLSLVLKNYRKDHKITQEQLASDLSIEPRTLRSWENERPTHNINELRRIADLLGVMPERLGLAASVYSPRTPEQIDEVVNHVWELVEEARVAEAQATIKQLLETIRVQITSEDHTLLHSLAHAYHAAGYVASINLRSYESYKALPFYRQVEEIARIINDHTLINIGLTYQGDMYQRTGDFTTAIKYLEAARDTTPLADVASLGNGIQLLGRAHFRIKDISNFEREMAKSEELTHLFDPSASSTRGHYNLGTVYEEYGRSYANLGQMQKALEYLDMAWANLPQTKFWELLITTARALALVKGGEIEAGVQLAVEAGEDCISTGNIRFLDRIHMIEQHLDDHEKKIRDARAEIRDLVHKGNVAEI